MEKTEIRVCKDDNSRLLVISGEYEVLLTPEEIKMLGDALSNPVTIKAIFSAEVIDKIVRAGMTSIAG